MLSLQSERNLVGYEDTVILLCMLRHYVNRSMLLWTCPQVLGVSFVLIVAFLRYADSLLLNTAYAFTKVARFMCCVRLSLSSMDFLRYFQHPRLHYPSVQLCKCDVCAGVNGHGKCLHRTQKQGASWRILILFLFTI